MAEAIHMVEAMAADTESIRLHLWVQSAITDIRMEEAAIHMAVAMDWTRLR